MQIIGVLRNRIQKRIAEVVLFVTMTNDNAQKCCVTFVYPFVTVIRLHTYMWTFSNV